MYSCINSLIKALNIALICLMADATVFAQQEQAYQSKSTKEAAKIKLPDAVVDAVKEEYRGYKITNIEKVKPTARGKKTYYAIRVEKGKEYYDMKITANGEIISRSWMTVYKR